MKNVLSKKPEQISNFSAFYEFLSNDYPTWVNYEGILFPSITTAFQAARSTNEKVRKEISEAQDYDELKKIVSSIKNPENWAQKREQVMCKLIRDKFKRSKEIALKLLATQSRELVNIYKKGGEYEKYWGMVQDKKGVRQGQNKLGKILMEMREQIYKGTDCENWINDQKLQLNQGLRAQVTIIVEKDNQDIEELSLGKKQKYLFGSSSSNDFKLDHQSISKIHTGIYFSSDMEILIVDFHSTHGTFIFRNGSQIKLSPLKPTAIENEDKIMFGQSLRKYKIFINNQKISAYIRQKQLQAQEQLRKIEELKRIQNEMMEQKKQIEAIKSILSFKNYTCLYVENVSRNYPYKDLKESFNKYGPVKNIRINIDQLTARYMGSVLIYFEEHVKVQDVLQTIREDPINPEFRIVAVDQVEAERIIQTFTHKKQQEPVKIEPEPIKKEIAGSKIAYHSRRSSSSSSLSRSRGKHKKSKKHKK